MTETDQAPPKPDGASGGYVPFGIDFDKLASDIRGFSGEGALPEALHGLVADALRHVRDETSGIDDQTTGRILMTAAVLVQSVEDAYSGWNGRMVANLLATLGQRFWDGTTQRPEPRHDATPEQPDPDQQPDGRFWAVWKPNGTLRTVEEFAEPLLGGEVLAQLTADHVIGPFELEPVSEKRARELRDKVEQVRR